MIPIKKPKKHGDYEICLNLAQKPETWISFSDFIRKISKIEKKIED